MKLAVFDFDSTLMDGETIDFIAKEANVYDEVSAITSSAMNGKLDFFESLSQRVLLLKGLNINIVNKVCQNLPFNKGAKETISALKQKGYKVICLSGGFDNATSYASKVLGLDASFSNYFYHKDSILTGQVGGAMMFGESKKEMILKIQALLNISKNDTIAIGDGANDLSMFEVSGLKIAFCAKEVLKKASDVQINTKDLSLILEHIK
ncbi:Phosphoserine phosphatase [hydrothermal vent metagenome]|uniref:phosphoserine phosphatase n=1 Tax=hydrothermal vent metagenome TaxID=652676 RepID=A0A3B1E6M5_9ZZZZ